MKRVTGIGGIFFKAKDPKKLAAWYRKHLGVEIEHDTMATYKCKAGASRARPGSTVWSVMPKTSKYFKPSKSPFMINYRVDDLHALLKQLRRERVAVDPAVEDTEFGKFGWVMDPEGNRVELWEPPAGM
jgi:predicted enzyme related to lactoylglutathione lyase